ncbi:MAG: hypothetical protein ACXVFQ_18230 [Solirubrobacteraceae bacterium]
MTPASNRDQTSQQDWSEVHAFAGFVLVCCVAVLFAHWLAASTACARDTSTCAHRREKTGTYQGVLVGGIGAQRLTLRNFAFSVVFPSRRDASPRSVEGFRTDQQGRYCIVWADERGLPYIDSVGEMRTLWQPLNGRDPPPGCRSGDEGIPWNRADGITDSPQFLAVPAILIPGLILLLIALVRGDVPEARRPRGAGFALALAGTALAALLWLT